MERKFYKGICLHAYSHNLCGKAYPKDEIEKQIFLASETGANLIRIGAAAGDWEYLDKIVSLSEKYGLDIMLGNSGRWNNYDEYFKETSEIVKRYPGKIKFFQALNETCNQALIKGFGFDGDKPEHYYLNKLEDICHKMLGITDAIREYASDVKIVVNGCWTHTFILDYFLEHGVPIDVIGWDYYSDQDAARPIKKSLDKLFSYGKPVIICETNYWPLEEETNQQDFRRAAFLKHMYDELISYPNDNLLGMIVYELKDEPHHPTPREQRFGIIKSKPDGHLAEPKYSFYMLRRLFGGKIDEQRYDAVIFDLDGVILETDEKHCLAWRYLADELNIKFNRATSEKMLAVAKNKRMDVFLEGGDKEYSCEEKKEFAERKNRYYLELIERITENDVSDGIVENIEFLKKHGVKVAAASTGINLNITLEKLGLQNVFDFVLDGNGISCGKPDSEIFVKLAEKMQIDPERCLVVDDSLFGVEAAMNCGMDVLGIGEAATDLKTTYGFEKVSDFCFGEDIRPYVK